MATAMELGAKITSERQEFAKWMNDHKAADGSYDLTGDNLTEFNKRNSTIAGLQAEFGVQSEAEKAAADNATKLAPAGTIAANKGDGEAEVKDHRIKDAEGLDRAFKSAFATHSDKLKSLANGGSGTVRFELPVEAKTLVTLADHYPQATRAQTTGSALYYNSVEDLFASGSTDANAVEYFIQTTDTDNAAFKAEGTAATDSAFVWTKTSDEVEEVATWIPVTRPFLNDNAGMQSMITNMLAARLDKAVSKDLCYGTGTTPQLWGASVRTGFQTQAKGTDPAFDAILKAATLVEVTGDATPDAIILHPTDFQNLLLTRTTDGLYILGNPGNSPANPSLWGLPIRVSSTVAAAAGTAIVGAFKTMAQIFNNGGVTVEASTEHSTYFTERKVALALVRRLTVVHYRPSAFCKITGL